MHAKLYSKKGETKTSLVDVAFVKNAGEFHASEASPKRVKMSLSRVAEKGREEEMRQKADSIVAIIGKRQ